MKELKNMHEAIEKTMAIMGTCVDIMTPLNIVPIGRMRPIAKKILLCPSVYDSIKRQGKIIDHSNKKTIAGTIQALEGVPVEERDIKELGYVIWQVRTDGLSEDELRYVEMYRVYPETAPR